MSEISQDVSNLTWYHANATRHVAESMLIQNGMDGAYLLRPSSKPDELALSVRCKDTVKHYNITWTGEEYKFGMATFESIKSFVNHFHNHPVLAGESGIPTALKFPYPRDVEEPGTYDTLLGLRPGLSQPQIGTLSVGSKEGYLTKLGGNVKNWKSRWFVAVRNELKYYKNETEKVPIRTLNLRECTMCCRDVTKGKDNCFKLVLPWRTFYMYADTREEMKSWMDLLQWKLEKLNSGDM